MTGPWWKNAVVYQVYPRSFQDSNGDGVGDLPGLTSRLGYLKDLGIDVLWLCPMFDSPNDDNGYDIRDYRAVGAEFGTLDDMKILLNRAQALGIKVILDLVVNHTSDEHPWFVESRRSPNSPYRDWYWWKPGQGDRPPTDYPSIFGGSAWQRDETTGEYYFHTFSPKQPDLNWENPAVRSAVCDIVDWWANLGVAGFRIDAITFIKKNLDWPTTLAKPPFVPVNEPGVLDFLREVRDRAFRPRDMMTVAEAPGTEPGAIGDYVGLKDGVWSMMFVFDHVDIDLRPGQPLTYADWSLTEWKATFSRWQKAAGDHSWLALYLENHDQVRSVSKFGDSGRYRKESAQVLAAWYFLMRGTPFVYQGQELGMVNAPFRSLDQYRDLHARNLYREGIEAGMTEDQVLEFLSRRGRDHSRTPFPWSAAPQGGFTEGQPWIDLNPDYPEVNAAAQQADPGSVLAYYQALIRLRKTDPVFTEGRYEELWPESPHVGAYRRVHGSTTVTVVGNFTAQEQPLVTPVGGRLLLSNYPSFDGCSLGPWQTVVVRVP